MDIKQADARSRNMSHIKNSRTKPEMYIRSLLHRNGFRYRANYTGLPGKPDVFFTKTRVALFVHGCFWHRHANCKYAYTPKSNLEFWLPKLERNRLHDEEVIKQLLSKNVRVLVLWECTVKKMIKNENVCIEKYNRVVEFINSDSGPFLEL